MSRAKEVVLRQRTPGERIAYYDGQLSRIDAQIAGMEREIATLRKVRVMAATFREIASEAPATKAKRRGARGAGL